MPGYWDGVHHVYVPGHWDPQPQGTQPPSSIKIGASGAQCGVKHTLALGLTVWDGLRQVGAGDQILVVPMTVTETVPRDPDGTGPRNLWWLNLPLTSELFSPTNQDFENYSEEMTLSPCSVLGLEIPLVYNWTKTGDHVTLEPLGDHAHVVATSASGDRNDVQVTLTMNGQEAVKHKLTVYSPTKLQLMQQNGAANRFDRAWVPQPGFQGFTTTYWLQVCDQLGNPVPSKLLWNETFGEFFPAGCNWSSINQGGEPYFATDWIGVFNDDYGKTCNPNSPFGRLDPLPLLPTADLAGYYVGFEPQYYCLGSKSSPDGVQCNYDGSGNGQIVSWSRGHGRQVPEPPGTLVADPAE